MLGGCNLVDNARAQVPIATSSGEAEWYSACGGSSEAIHVAKVCSFVFGKEIRIVVLTDSTVCKAIGARQGVGKIKHLETKSLWLQQKIKDKVLYVRKVGTKDNCADLGTKVFGPTDFTRLQAMNGYYECQVVDKFDETKVKKIVNTLAASSGSKGRAGKSERRRYGGFGSQQQQQQSAIEACLRALIAAILCCRNEGKEHDGGSGVTSWTPRSQNYEEEGMSSSTWKLMLLSVLVVAVTIQVWRCWTSRVPKLTKEVGTQTRRTTKRTMLTQSQATYDWHLAVPRFRSLQRENDHGAWAEATEVQ